MYLENNQNKNFSKNVFQFRIVSVYLHRQAAVKTQSARQPFRTPPSTAGTPQRIRWFDKNATFVQWQDIRFPL